MKTTVVHCKKSRFDVYVGRGKNVPMHFGNPFTFKAGTLAAVVLPKGECCIQAFDDWLAGRRFQEVEPDRRRWILENIPTLQGKVLGCWCSPNPCHGDVLADRADNQAQYRLLDVQPAMVLGKDFQDE